MTKKPGGITPLGSMGTFLKVGTCSETLCNIMNRAFEHPMKPEEHAATPLAGGIVQHGYQCGMIWGASLAAGAQAHRLFGPGPKAEAMAVHAAGKVVEAFRAHTGEINCLEITDIDNTSSVMKMIYVFLIRGGTIGCFRMSAKYAPLAYGAISTALSEDPGEIPCDPVSCTATLAKKMGATEQHTGMAAGLAGGIGLCGGACGALGAAIWLTFAKSQQEGNKKVGFKDPRAMKLIDTFLKTTGYKFECSEIAGRKFTNLADHAEYVQGGGCKEIIEGLGKQA